MGVAELAEASARSGAIDVAVAAVRRLDERTPADRTDSALGVQARSHALLNGHGSAEVLYREAIKRLAGSRIALELARTQLLYGEWLRRRSRRVDAREQLRPAHATFSHMGAGGLPSAPDGSWWPRAKRSGDEASRLGMRSPPRRR